MIDPEYIKGCDLCPLQGDTYAYPRIHRGEGPKVMFIGMCPGDKEAIKHEVFVGPSGRLLDEWIQILGIENYYITNVVKHRPTTQIGNKRIDRYPNKTEIDACLPYLDTELEKEQPDYIITLGEVPTKALFIEMFYPDLKFTEVVNRFILNGKENSFLHPINGKYITSFPLFHPSYILRGGTRITPYLDSLKEMVK